MLECANIKHGLKVGTDGTIAPCCMAQKVHYRDENDNILNVETATARQILDSPTRKTLIKQFELGLKAGECTACWESEAAGIESKRIRDTERLEDPNYTTDDIFLLDLQLGNTCNLACRTCGIEGTRKWKDEYKEIVDSKISDQDFKDLVKKFSKPFQDESTFWDQLPIFYDKAGFIDLYGGEPFLMAKQWEVLKGLADNGKAKEKMIQINSNGTVFSEKYFNVLKEFKDVLISFSIDGTEGKFEYLRHHGNWNEVLSNMIKWKEVTKDLDYFNFNICFTVSTYNILDFPELVSLAAKLGFDIYCNYVYQPTYFKCSNIPDEYKQELSDTYYQNVEKYTVNLPKQNGKFFKDYILPKLEEPIKFALSFKNNGDNYERFLRVTKLLDKSRTNNFSKTFPQLNHVLKLDRT